MESTPTCFLTGAGCIGGADWGFRKRPNCCRCESPGRVAERCRHRCLNPVLYRPPRWERFTFNCPMRKYEWKAVPILAYCVCCWSAWDDDHVTQPHADLDRRGCD